MLCRRVARGLVFLLTLADDGPQSVERREPVLGDVVSMGFLYINF